MNYARTKMIALAWTVLGAVLLAGCADSADSLLAAAKESLAKKDRNTAIIHLKNALETNPDLGEARFLLGKSQLEAGEIAAAEKQLRRARELKVPDDQVVPALARAMIATGEFKKTLEEFGDVGLTTPEARADLSSTLAQAQMATGNKDAAAAGFAAALKAMPGYPPALLGEARLRAAADDLGGAQAILDTALTASPDLFEGWLLKGDVAAARGEPDNALVAYRKALDLRTDSLAAHSRIIPILIQQQKTQEANLQVEAMKKIAPQNPQTLYFQALMAFREKNFAAAREAIQLQLRAAPDNLQGLVLSGSIEYHLGSYDQAEVSLKKALMRAPKQRLARIMLVNTYLRSRQPARALEALKPLLDDGDASVDVLTLAGEVYMLNGNGKDAERAFAKALALDPKDANKRTALALTHVRGGEIDRGMRELEEVAAADSGIRADLALIAAHTRDRKYDAALTAIAALEKKQPDKPLAHALRGQIYSVKGDGVAARQSFERALAIDPGDFTAAAGLAELDFKDKKPEDARKRFESVLAKDPKNMRALLAVAELSARGGATTDEVVALIGKAVAAEPSGVAPRLALIHFLLRSKEPKRAVTAAQEALAALPDRLELVDAAGQAYLAAGDANQAITEFSKLVKARSGAFEPYVRLASAQMAAKDPDAAMQSLKKALALKPDLVGVQRAMVKLDLEAGREAEALVTVREIQKQRPKESIGYLLEGDINVARKAWPAAIAAYRNGLKHAGTTDLAVRLDAALRYSGSAVEADKSLAAWLRDHPKDREIRAYLAETALGKNDYATASAHYKAMVEIKADDPMALNNLAYVSGQLRDPKALEYAERAVKLAPNHAAVLDTYGMLLVEKGETKRGLEYMQRASELAPAASGIRLNLARALLKDGQKPAAKKELEALAKLGDRFSEQAEVTKLMQGI